MSPRPRGKRGLCEEGWRPVLCTPPHEGALRPSTPAGFMRSWELLHPPAGAPREHGFAMLGTRVTFPSRGKSPKARQGLRPLESPEGDASLPLRFPHPLDRVSDTTKDRFATLSWWANRSCFFLRFHRGNTLCFQSVARQVGLASACCRSGTPFWGERRLPPLGG